MLQNKTKKEIYYDKILTKCHKRHKKVDDIRTISTNNDKKINWDKLSEHFKNSLWKSC